MTSDKKRIVLQPSVKNLWLDGKVCPENGDFPITFLLESAIAGDREVRVNLGINSIVPVEYRLKSEDIEVAEAG